MTALQILTTGPLALVQDLGRPGLAHVGVARSGAADRRAHRLANRLVANPADLATVEITFGGLAARVLDGSVDIAVTGADACATVDLEYRSATAFATSRPVRSSPSASRRRRGMRSYLAVRGGIAVTPVLDSRSFDTMSKLGPDPLRPGDVLPVGEPPTGFPEIEVAPVAASRGRPGGTAAGSRPAG